MSGDLQHPEPPEQPDEVFDLGSGMPDLGALLGQAQAMQ